MKNIFHRISFILESNIYILVNLILTRKSAPIIGLGPDLSIQSRKRPQTIPNSSIEIWPNVPPEIHHSKKDPIPTLDLETIKHLNSRSDPNSRCGTQLSIKTQLNSPCKLGTWYLWKWTFNAGVALYGVGVGGG